jgi:hypothetical protein
MRDVISKLKQEVLNLTFLLNNLWNNDIISLRNPRKRSDSK